MRNLITDVPGILVGQSEIFSSSPKNASGVTVICGEKPLIGSYVLRGGAPASREIALLAPEKLVTHIDALCLSGGSAYGLAAADQLMQDFFQLGRGFPTRTRAVPIISAAALFDLPLNPESLPDYRALAHQAFLARGKNFSLGNCGAGAGAVSGQLKGGVGSASAHLPQYDGIIVGAIAAVNSFGSAIANRQGKFFADDFLRPEDDPDHIYCQKSVRDSHISSDALAFCKAGFHRENTTLAVIATNLSLTKTQLAMISQQASDGLARAIAPCHTVFDGDILFALSTATQKMPVPDDKISQLLTLLAVTSSNCLSRCVMRAMIESNSLDNISSYRDFVKNDD